MSAARALGDVGSAAVVPGLLAALDASGGELARVVTVALLRLDPSGAPLADHPSPHAAEAVALRRLRRAA